MEALLIIIFKLIVMFCFFSFLYWLIILKAGNVKKLDAQLHREENDELAKRRRAEARSVIMLSKARQIIELAEGTNTYEDYCVLQEHARLFKKSFQKDQGFERIYAKIEEALEIVREYVREREIIARFEWRYTPE